MLTLSLHIALILLLAIAFYQDWKYRAIIWVLFPLLFGVSILVFWKQDLSWEIILYNLTFIGVVIGCLTLYISIKMGKMINIFKAHLGLGDVLFLLAISPLFISRNFILFFISGMFLSGVVHIIAQSFGVGKKIPLAGYLSIYLIGMKAADLMSVSNLFYDTIL